MKYNAVCDLQNAYQNHKYEKDVSCLFDEYNGWAERVFANQSIQGKLNHLGREVEELKKSPTEHEEFADVFLLLINSAHCAGMTFGELCTAAWKKFEINKKREWGKPDEDDVIEHMTEST